jgi:hypothetical protein
MPVLEKDLLNPEWAAPLPDSNLSADRSTVLADLLADVLRHGQHHPIRLRVHGESMLPSLWPGDEVEIGSCSLEDLRPGDIALALRGGRIFLHRLLAIKPNGFVLRGDSMPGPDPIFPVEALLGRLVGRDSSGGKRPRVAGWFMCHCGMARRLALKLHQPSDSSGRLASETGAS